MTSLSRVLWMCVDIAHLLTIRKPVGLCMTRATYSMHLSMYRISLRQTGIKAGNLSDLI